MPKPKITKAEKLHAQMLAALEWPSYNLHRVDGSDKAGRAGFGEARRDSGQSADERVSIEDSAEKGLTECLS